MRLLPALGLLLVLQAGMPAQAQTTAGASAPASAAASAPARAQVPEQPAAAPINAGTWQGLRYGAGYQARQSTTSTAVDRAPQAPAHRRGRGR
jgi:hypothetical protein